MNEKQKKLSLRDLFHILGSKHQVSILGTGVIQDYLENLRDRQKISELPLEYKETIKKTITDLEAIKKASKEADALLNQIKDIVYKKLDPDKIKVEREESVEIKKKGRCEHY